MHGAIQKHIQNLVGKHEGKRPLGRSRHRWKDNINMDLGEVGCNAGDSGYILLKIESNGMLL